MREMRRRHVQLTEQVEGLLVAEAASASRAARAAQEAQAQMHEATGAIGQRLQLQLEATLAEERRCCIRSAVLCGALPEPNPCLLGGAL